MAGQGSAKETENMSFNMYPNFVSASTTIVSGHQELVSDQNTNHSGELSGEEAKSFYEYIVYGDENSISERDSLCEYTNKNSQVQCTDTRLSNSTYSNERKSAILEKKSDIVGQVFRYAQEGNLKALKKALRGNGTFDINVKDKFLWTPLMCGAHAGHKLVVKFLLEKGAVWRNNYDQKGNSAIDLARLGGHSDVEMFLLENEKVKGMCIPKNSQCKVVSNEKYWCTQCQMECTEDKRKHEASTVHLFNSEQKSHKTVYSIPEHSIGYQMMISSGWDAEKGEKE